MTRADIESTEKQNIWCHYAGKQAPWASCKKLTGVVIIGGKGLMKFESGHSEKERLEIEKVVRNAMKGKKGKAKAKEPTKPKAHTPGTSPEFCLPLVGV